MPTHWGLGSAPRAIMFMLMHVRHDLLPDHCSERTSSAACASRASSGYGLISILLETHCRTKRTCLLQLKSGSVTRRDVDGLPVFGQNT